MWTDGVHVRLLEEEIRAAADSAAGTRSSRPPSSFRRRQVLERQAAIWAPFSRRLVLRAVRDGPRLAESPGDRVAAFTGYRRP
eukprot:9493621-Pyramimonas_sp.AAC.1